MSWQSTFCPLVSACSTYGRLNTSACSYEFSRYLTFFCMAHMTTITTTILHLAVSCTGTRSSTGERTNAFERYVLYDYDDYDEFVASTYQMRERETRLWVIYGPYLGSFRSRHIDTPLFHCTNTRFSLVCTMSVTYLIMPYSNTSHLPYTHVSLTFAWAIV